MGDHTNDEEQRRLASQALADRHFLNALEAIDPLLANGSTRIEDWLFAGQVLTKVREYAQAAEVLRTGLLLQPDHVQSRYELAIALFQLGDVPSATELFQQIASDSGLFVAWQSLATIIPGCPNADHERVLDVRREFVSRLTTQQSANQCDREDSPMNLLVQGASHSRIESSAEPKRIRLGYISAFFHRANYMKPVWGLINGHDRERFEVQLFADDSQPDQLAWFQSGPKDRIHTTSDMDNDELRNLIRQQSLDIVIDLNAYSVNARLGLFTQRLAPNCVAWFNMYATSALPGIDWIVGDQYVIRPEEEAAYTERVMRLPCSYLGFVVGHDAPDVVPPPCLRNRVFTFGSLVSQYKITPTVLDAWCEILRRVPESRLLLANRAMKSTMNRQYLMAEFARRGISNDRLLLLPPADHFAYLQYYDQIDIALDAFPYNGGTTTTEAIWQGVPVLAFDGDRWAARTSRTLLMNCHLKEFVLADQHEWIEAAVHWGNDVSSPERLREIRSTMRSELLNSNVCRMHLMVQAMEEFYFCIAKS